MKPSPVVPATTPGNVPAMRVGLLIIVPAEGVAYEAWVAMEEVELDRVGDEGRIVGTGCGGGDGAIE